MSNLNIALTVFSRFFIVSAASSPAVTVPCIFDKGPSYIRHVILFLRRSATFLVSIQDLDIYMVLRASSFTLGRTPFLILTVDLI
jgi:hypothetical protein